MTPHGVHEIGQRRLEPIAADAVRGFPKHDDRLADGLIVDAPSRNLLPFLVSRLNQEPDAMLVMVAGYRGELVQDPVFLLL